LVGEITRVAFSAVIGMEDGQDGDSFQIVVEVINNGVTYRLGGNERLDHVWLHYNVQGSFKLKGDNLHVKFKCEDKYSKPSNLVFFKSCGFHLVRIYV
jgi:predicted ATPase